MKLKSFCTAKENTNKTTRQPSEWEKIFAYEATDIGLISEIYKQFMQLNIKKNKQPIPKMGRRPKHTFLQRRYTYCQQTHERMLNITNHHRDSSQSKMRYHLTPVRMAIIKKTTNNNCWRGCGQKGAFLHCWWECKLGQLLWKAICRFHKQKYNYHLIQQFHSEVFIQRKEKHNFQKDIYTRMFIAALFTIAKI